jgi:hypothetical protein
MNQKSGLDFIIIGAQKSGTTSLFKYLAVHPEVYLPPNKETNFFHKDEFYSRGISWFFREFFENVSEDLVWGEASPSYMTNDSVPARIVHHFPDVKLIAILRDPIERAYSHYKMNVRRALEGRQFEEAITMQLKTEALDSARSNYSEERNCYIVWGEYGRILTHYLDYFSLEQLLVLFTSDLAESPSYVMQKVYKFLDIESILPKNLGERFHRGGTKVRFPDFKSFARKLPLARALWGLLPLRMRIRLNFSFERWNVIPEKEVSIPLSDEVVNALRSHYYVDAIRVKSIAQSTPPWLG